MLHVSSDGTYWTSEQHFKGLCADCQRYMPECTYYDHEVRRPGCAIGGCYNNLGFLQKEDKSLGSEKYNKKE